MKQWGPADLAKRQRSGWESFQRAMIATTQESFFSKEERGGAFFRGEGNRPAIEDPVDSENNISGATSSIHQIREAMRATYRILTGSEKFDFGVLAR